MYIPTNVKLKIGFFSGKRIHLQLRKHGNQKGKKHGGRQNLFDCIDQVKGYTLTRTSFYLSIL